MMAVFIGAAYFHFGIGALVGLFAINRRDYDELTTLSKPVVFLLLVAIGSMVFPIMMALFIRKREIEGTAKWRVINHEGGQVGQDLTYADAKELAQDTVFHTVIKNKTFSEVMREGRNLANKVVISVDHENMVIRIGKAEE